MIHVLGGSSWIFSPIMSSMKSCPPPTSITNMTWRRKRRRTRRQQNQYLKINHFDSEFENPEGEEAVRVDGVKEEEGSERTLIGRTCEKSSTNATIFRDILIAACILEARELNRTISPTSGENSLELANGPNGCDPVAHLKE